MSETLKFNEYCRTKLGEIFRVVGINEFDRNIFYDKHGARYYRDEIIKHSENIIDLIEERRLCEWLSSKKNTEFLQCSMQF